jgi:hypothetical protein
MLKRTLTRMTMSTASHRPVVPVIVNSDGTLTEQPCSMFIYPPEVEPTNARPKGLIVL